MKMPFETPLRELHEKLGAPLATWFGCSLPKRFTDLATEYREARESVALLDTNYRAFITFEGPDRVRYLNALLTSNIQELAVGQGNVGLLLNPQGHILAELETYALADRHLTLSHALVRERTVETLDKFIIMDDVTLVDATERFGSLAIEGPQAAGIVKELCGIALAEMPPRSHGETALAGIPCRLVRRSNFGEPGAEFIAERGRLAPLWHALLGATRSRGGGPIGYSALNVLRLEAGVPWFSYDFDDTVIPHEAALESSHISFTKGCYTGQEIVERVHSRGHVNRRRVSLEFSGATLPQRGAKLTAEGNAVGHVTSAANSQARGRAIGMGYLRREHNSVGSVVEWPGGTATVIELRVTGATAARS